MSGNNILCMYCESHHHVSEHDQCKREAYRRKFSRSKDDYHAELGSELEKLINGNFRNLSHPSLMFLEGDIDTVQLGKWMSEAFDEAHRTKII